MDASKFIFSGRYNFQKIYLNSSGTFTVPDTTFTTTPILLATHTLNIIPKVRVFYEPIAGQLWPLMVDQFDNLDGGSGTPLSIIGTARVTTSTLTVDLFNTSGSPQSVKFYWRIYLD